MTSVHFQSEASLFYGIVVENPARYQNVNAKFTLVSLVADK